MRLFCDFQTPCLICFVELYNNWSIWLVTLYQTKNQRTWIGCKTGLDGVSRRLQPPSWKSDRIHAKLGRVSVEVGCSASENRNLKRLFFDRKVDQVSRFRNYNFQICCFRWVTEAQSLNFLAKNKLIYFPNSLCLWSNFQSCFLDFVSRKPTEF